MIGFVFQLSATGVAQSVKIEKQHQTLETVFEQVESQTGLLIMFSNNELDVNRKITLDVRKYTLNELFRKIVSVLSFVRREPFLHEVLNIGNHFLNFGF